MAVTTEEETRAISEVVRRLHNRFPQVDDQTIHAEVQHAHHEFDGAHIRDFVPLFVERNATERIQRGSILQPA